MNELKPMLFSVLKGYTKEQFLKDTVSGIIVAIIAVLFGLGVSLAFPPISEAPPSPSSSSRT